MPYKIKEIIEMHYIIIDTNPSLDLPLHFDRIANFTDNRPTSYSFLMKNASRDQR